MINSVKRRLRMGVLGLVLFALAASGASLADRVADKDALFYALMEVRTHEEGLRLIEENRPLLDYGFIVGCAEILPALSSHDLETAQLVSHILIDVVRFLQDEVDGKNALGWCLSAQAGIMGRQDRLAEAQSSYEQALQLFVSDPEYLPGIAATYANLANVMMAWDSYPEALQLLERAVASYQAIDAPLGEARARENLAILYIQTWRLDEAEAQLQQALDRIRAIDASLGYPEAIVFSGRQTEAGLHLRKGSLYLSWQRYEDAFDEVKQGGALYHEIQDPVGLFQAFLGMGNVRLEQGRTEDAVMFYKGAEEGARVSLSVYPTAREFVQILLGSLLGLGGAYHHQGRHEASEENYREALGLARDEGDETAVAAAQLNLGLLLADRRRHTEAEESIAGALEDFEKLRDWDGVIRCYAALSAVAAATRDFDRAIAFSRRSVEKIEDLPMQDSVLLAGIWNNRGALYFERGDLASAEEAYLRALEFYEESGSPVAYEVYINLANLHLRRGSLQKAEDMCEAASEAMSALSLGRGMAAVRGCRAEIHLAAGRYVEAETCFLEALEASKQMDDPSGMLHAYNGIARVCHQTARFADALRYYNSALELAQNTLYSRQEEAVVHQGIGGVYASLGDQEKAIGHYGDALSILQEVGDERTLAVCYANIGASYVSLGRHVAAEDYLLTASDLLEASGGQSERAFVLLNLGYLMLESDRPESALEHLQTACQTSIDVGDVWITALANMYLGDLNAEQSPSVALVHYEHAREYFTTASFESGLAQVLARVGRLQEREGREEEALEAFQSAIEALEASRATLEIEELESLWPQLGLDTYFDLASLLVENGQTALALSYAERFKAKALVDLMASGWVGFESGAAQDLLQQEQSLFHEISLLERQLREESRLSQGQRREQLIEELKEILEYKKEQYSNLLAKMKLQSPRYASLHTVTPTELAAVYHQVQESLPPRTPALEYFVGRDETVVWLIDGNGVQTVSRIPISRAELAHHVRTFREEVNTGPAPGEGPTRLLRVRELGRDLYDLLVAPVEEYLEDVDHLVIVPSDVLFYVPFGALFDCPDCAGGGLLGGEYLIERYSLSYAPSLSSLYWPFQHRGDGAYGSVLSVGNPTGDLEFAAVEARSIAQLFPRPTLLLEEEGTEAAVKEALQARRYDAVHLSTHGLFDPVLPLVSRLALREGDGEDGALYAGEILGLPLDCELVVLSACQTALPPELTEEAAGLVVGDELQGLSQALFVAGAPSAVMTLWNVYDPSTAELMTEMYQELIAGQAKGQALQQAQLVLLRDERGLYNHPYYWSPFVLYGDWR